MTYQFGDPGSERRGVMHIDKADPRKSAIVKMPDDGSVPKNEANYALVKLIKRALKGEYPKRESYCV